MSIHVEPGGLWAGAPHPQGKVAGNAGGISTGPDEAAEVASWWCRFLLPLTPLGAGGSRFAWCGVHGQALGCRREFQADADPAARSCRAQRARACEGCQGDGQHDVGRGRAGAVPGTKAVGEKRGGGRFRLGVGLPALRIEHVRVGVAVPVPAQGPQRQGDHGSGRDPYTALAGLVAGAADQERDAMKTGDFLDEGGRERKLMCLEAAGIGCGVGFVPERLLVVRVAAQFVAGPGEGGRAGLHAGDQQGTDVAVHQVEVPAGGGFEQGDQVLAVRGGPVSGSHLADGLVQFCQRAAAGAAPGHGHPGPG